jgi:3-hydroxyisobutyrate dehydrogenase-like beta-hydroxyacid dehydrogenase
MTGEVTQIGFLGLGQMGAPMAELLFGPDVRLHVFDPLRMLPASSPPPRASAAGPGQHHAGGKAAVPASDVCAPGAGRPQRIRFQLRS